MIFYNKNILIIYQAADNPYKNYINNLNFNNKNAHINSKYFIRIIKPFNSLLTVFPGV